jgi:hypothetical protein
MEARQAAAEALKLVPTTQGVEVEAALAYAMEGDTARAESLAQDDGDEDGAVKCERQCQRQPTNGKSDRHRHVRSVGCYGATNQPRSDAGLLLGVPSMFRQLEGESPFDNLVEVKR